tara:strand:+ start:99 stop:341 length:243 start_codon:yes stop_codon:yes gene_type:complete
MTENNKIMDKIVENMGKDYDYNMRIESRKLQKQGEDPQDISSLAEKEAIKKVKKKYGFKQGGPVCKLATKGKGRAYGKNS